MKILQLKNHFINTALAVLFFIFLCSSAQGAQPLHTKFRLSVINGDIKKAEINITKNGSFFKKILLTDSLNSMDLDLNSKYVFTFSKPGYITKSIEMNLKVPDGRENREFATIKITIELHPQPKDSNVSYKKPVGRFFFNSLKDDFDYDKNYGTIPLEKTK